MIPITCPYCGSNHVVKRGKHPKLKYQCQDKKHSAALPRYFYNEKSVARVLLFDIETLPGIKRFWRLGEQDWNIESVISDWIVLGYSGKWLFEPKVTSGILSPAEAKARNDKRLVEEIWKMFNEADVIIAHNGDHFDIPRMNTRFLYYDSAIPSPYLTIDTKSTAQRAFGFTSNRLDYLAKYLGLATKLHTDYNLWVRCEAGEKEALTTMNTYNVQDAFVLEDVYVKLRPWIRHPNMSLYMSIDKEDVVCPKCGSDDVDWGETYRTTASIFDAFRCNHCGSIGRMKSRKSTTGVRSFT